MRFMLIVNMIGFLSAWVLVLMSIFTESWVQAIFWLLMAVMIGSLAEPTPGIPKAWIKFQGKFRDMIGYYIIRLGLRFASERYRNFISGSVEYGLSSAIRDEEQGYPAPESWRENHADIPKYMLAE